MANHGKVRSDDAIDKLTTAAGVIEPEMKKLADYIRPRVPQAPERIQRLIGIANAWVASKANNVHPLFGLVLTQVTRIVDDVWLDRPEKHKDARAAKVVGDGLIGKHAAEAPKRIKEAADPAAEAVRIEAEMDALHALFERINKKLEDHAKSKEPPKKEPVDLQIDEGFKTLFTALDTAWDQSARRRGYIPPRRRT